MRLAIVMLFLLALPAQADGLSGSISTTHNHHFQGFRQNDNDVSLHGAAQFTVGNLSTGVWAGRFEFPGGTQATTEIDYFVSLDTEVGFRHRFEMSLWHYDYTDQQVSSYDWSQLLARYHYETWLTLTVGLADNLLRTDGPVILTEAQVRYPLVSGLSLSFALGHNHFREYPIDPFSYGTLKAIFGEGPWHAVVDYTITNADEAPTKMWVHEGISIGLTYTFD